MEFAIPGQPQWRVSYDSRDEGGGTWFGQEYIEVLQKKYSTQWHHCLEWCSGPGFIGFGIMAHGLCQNLTLQDRHAPLTDHVNQTCVWNNCKTRTDFFLGDSIGCIPARQFDLIVANPPHYLECPGDDNYQRLAVDTNWQTHENFFQNVSFYLARDGIILLQENQAGSLRGVYEFWDMIHNNRLEVTAYWTSTRYWNAQGPTQIYYIEIQHQKQK